MNIFVGNLSFDSSEADLKKLFEGFGSVAYAVIVMRKEKKAPKSRGFGFVEMPDEQQALAAMAALDGEEFMGRVINVNPSRPKTEGGRESKPEGEGRPGRYKSGRRTHSYMKRRGLTRMQIEAKPRRSPWDNPMRWRKKTNKPKPRKKSLVELKPWEKAAGEPKFRKKPAGDALPRSKSSRHPYIRKFH